MPQPMQIGICPECGHPVVWKGVGRKPKYCSQRCARRVGFRAHQERVADAVCSIDECDRPLVSNGYCGRHYYRWQRYGDPLAQPQRNPDARVCKANDCENRAQTSDDLCPTHSRRRKLYGDPNETFATARVCAIDGCGNPPTPTSRSSEYCRDHLVGFVKAEAIAGRVEPVSDPRGYQYVSVFKKRYAIHRLVMEDVLNRPLQPFESPHHINGDKADNRPENLELWVKPQPAGQRAADLARWVVDTYPDLVSEAMKEQRP